MAAHIKTNQAAAECEKRDPAPEQNWKIKIRGIEIISQPTVIGDLILAHHRPGADLLPCGGGRHKDRPGSLRVANDVFQHFGAEIGIRTVGKNDDPCVVRSDGLIDQTLHHEQAVVFAKRMT